MLTLSRKVGERIVIGDNIVLTVLRISGSQVRLGIQAETHVPILRGELVDDYWPRGGEPKDKESA